MPAILINGHGDVSNSAQRTISGAYLAQTFGGRLSYVRIQDGVGGGVFYYLGYANPDASGQWSVTVTLGGMTLNSAPGSGFQPGAEGQHTIVAQALDPSGNLLVSSAPVVYKLQRKGPMTFAAIPDGTKTATIPVSGTIDLADAALPISIVDGARPLAQLHAATGGQWSANVTLTGVGAHTLYAAATDAVGNRGESQNVVTQFNTVPPQPTLASAAPTTPAGVFLLSGGVDPLDAARPVTIFDGNAQIAQVPPLNVGDNGAWTVAVVLAPGAHTLSAKATNAAGTGTSAPIAVQAAAPR
jgi:hypothetical protein